MKTYSVSVKRIITSTIYVKASSEEVALEVACRKQGVVEVVGVIPESETLEGQVKQMSLRTKYRQEEQLYMDTVSGFSPLGD